MRRWFLPVLTAAAVIAASTLPAAQFGDADRVIPGGGVLVKGWTGKIDAGSTRQGRVLNDAKLAEEGGNLHVTTGPAVTYWNLANTASGDYTVKAKITNAIGSVAGEKIKVGENFGSGAPLCTGVPAPLCTAATGVLDSSYDGVRVRLTPATNTGRIIWTCASGGTGVTASNRPEACATALP